MNQINSIGIFCGSKLGNHPIYAEQVKGFAKLLCQQNITIVYGGADMGLMKVIADEALESGNKIIGVMPEKLVNIEQAHNGLADFRIVKDMAERKAMIAELSDAFVMLPGGIGSFDEFFEMLTLAHLGYQSQRSAILNIHGYYDKLIEFLNHASKEGFLYADYLQQLVIESDSSALMEQLLATTSKS